MAATVVGAGHPAACQATTPTGPCTHEKCKGSLYCDKHKGFMAANTEAKAALQNYRINTDWGRRAAEMARNPHLKSLTDEIALSRMALEGVVKKIQCDDDVLIYSERIMSMSAGISKLLDTTQRIQERNRDLLDRETIFSIAEAIIGILASKIDDPDLVLDIGGLIHESIINRISRPDEVQTSTARSNQSLALGY